MRMAAGVFCVGMRGEYDSSRISIDLYHSGFPWEDGNPSRGQKQLSGIGCFAEPAVKLRFEIINGGSYC